MMIILISISTANRTDKSLRNYIRFDGNGKIVSGSLISRRTKPKGNWVEVSSGLCCTETTQTPT